MKIYKIRMQHFGKEVSSTGIKEVECVRLTNNFVVFENHREAKVTDLRRYFPTYKEAAKFYKYRAQNQIKYHKACQEALQKVLKSI